MGDAPPAQDRILIANAGGISPALLEEIQAKFPSADITYLKLENFTPIPIAEYARRATHIVTFSNLPSVEDVSEVKLIHLFSAGVDHIMTHPIVQETNIPLTSSSGIHGPPIAEWVIMNWLVASRRFVSIYKSQEQHVWGKYGDWMTGVRDQVGRKVGILGYGSIGRQSIILSHNPHLLTKQQNGTVGRVASALGMKVYAHTASPRPTPASRIDRGYIVPGTGDREGTIPVSWHHGTDRASIREFLALGLDHLVIALPLTPQTTHLLGAAEFQLLAEHAPSKPYVTNIARGKIVDQKALVAALQDGVLGGAALDVTDPEPLPAEDPLWDAPNVQISPHISGAGMEYIPRSLDILKENLGRLARGEEILNEYKRGKGY
ncbi:D-isomer specific 2-hydroxyacid dehydrogenase family protein [Aspergillus saccharolyticus JOP 1030-1]|uniref:Dehydrogenase n=1 Tax=Aspergillus saccharolyticus JOP 1030-1 TaxID=1450539 RepID=A0A318Z4H6_9EURO|nr:dehydrogenase [Aspergillus saccharolyticus JOP 1030-1]PYH41247.1 dehydrogenase [Aspergillus saccharolyticus JOP 1030-1]